MNAAAFVPDFPSGFVTVIDLAPVAARSFAELVAPGQYNLYLIASATDGGPQPPGKSARAVRRTRMVRDLSLGVLKRYTWVSSAMAKKS